MFEWVRFYLTAALLLSGLFLMITGVIGQYRLKYVLNRMHAASMGDSLGLLLSAAALSISADSGWTVAKFLMTALFLWVTSPTGSHLIARLELTVNEHPETEMEMTGE